MDLLIDLSVKVTRQADKDAHGNEKQASFGHLGTHFDVMDKEFPLAFTRREGIAFDVSDVEGRDIGTRDVDLAPVEAGMFAAFRTGFIERDPTAPAPISPGIRSFPTRSSTRCWKRACRSSASTAPVCGAAESTPPRTSTVPTGECSSLKTSAISENCSAGRRRRGLSHGPSRSILTG